MRREASSPCAARWRRRRKTPQFLEQSPTATTSRGSGIALYVVARAGHVHRHWSGDRQHVGVSRRGDQADSESLRVIDGRKRLPDLDLVVVARPGVDVTYSHRTRDRRGLREPLTRRHGLLRRAAGPDNPADHSHTPTAGRGSPVRVRTGRSPSRAGRRGVRPVRRAPRSRACEPPGAVRQPVD